MFKNAPMTANYSPCRDRNDGSYNVTLNGSGTVIAGIKPLWARKAAHLLNHCETGDEQAIELTRIRRSIYAAGHLVITVEHGESQIAPVDYLRANWRNHRAMQTAIDTAIRAGYADCEGPNGLINLRRARPEDMD